MGNGSTVSFLYDGGFCKLFIGVQSYEKNSHAITLSKENSRENARKIANYLELNDKCTIFAQ
jgi:hypothetical protein